MLNKTIQFLEAIDKVPNNKVLRWFKKFMLLLFYPILIVIETITYYIIWNKCVREICSDDELIHFLDENDFGIDRIKFIKKDLILSDNPLFKRTEEEIERELNYQFSEAITNIIRKNMVSDIEKYISIVSNMKTYNTHIKIYEVAIVYYRINIYFHRLLIFTILTIALLIMYCVVKFGFVTINF